VANADNLAPLPRSLDLLHAGAAAPTGLTALQGVDDALRLRRGQTILIVGATGAVGTLAVQFAKRKQARVIATASGAEATRLARELGADAVVDARSDAVAEQLRALAPKGIDAALVLAGGDNVEECLDVVRAGGRIAYPNGVEPAPRRRRGIRLIAYDGEVGSREFARLDRAAREAKLRVPIAAVLPLARAQEGHKRLDRGHVLGRMVLRVQ
jgi:NADPH:quinone reductase-like Zn-dependent oxidoreductase